MQIEKLRSLIRESINEYIREIDNAANEASQQAKVNACEEAIKVRKERLERISENEDLKEMVDETKVKEIQNEIRALENYSKKSKKVLEKMKAKKDKKENPEKEEKVTTDTPIDEADVTAEMKLSDEESKALEDKAKENDKQYNPMNESFIRMQKLAGVITEAQYNQKRKALVENQINDETFKWKGQPQNPDDMLMDYDEGEEITKASFWETDIRNRSKEDTIPNYAQEENGKWRFQWDAGDIGGFVEGEDFTF